MISNKSIMYNQSIKQSPTRSADDASLISTTFEAAAWTEISSASLVIMSISANVEGSSSSADVDGWSFNRFVFISC